MKIKWKIVLAISVFLVIIISITNFYFYRIIKNLVKEETSVELENYSYLGLSMLDAQYPGDWRLEGGILYKGTQALNLNYELVDNISEHTGIISTLFAYDTRVSTTVKDDKGNRKIDTKASDKVIEAVLNRGEPYQGAADVAGKQADTYYTPLRDSEGKVVGMWFVGVYNEDINKKIINALLSGTAVLGILTLIGIAFAYMMGKTISRGFNRIRGYLERLEQGDFRIEFHEEYKNRRDELGDISRSFDQMQRHIRDIITSIKNEAAKIEASSNVLAVGADTVYNNVEDISATTEELSAGMEETAASTQEMNATAVEIEADVSKVASKAKVGLHLASEIKERAIKLQGTALNSKQEAINMYGEANKKLRHSIQKAEAINEINALSKAIQDINSQTNLLALNASIESARAGEAGKGFAVVASQIGELAKNSKDTVSRIEEITSIVALAVEDMVDDSKNLLDFVDHKVIPDYKVLEQISGQYHSDAGSVEDMVTEIDRSTEHLLEAIHYIRQAIDEVTTATEEGSKGSVEIADKSTSIFHKTTEVLEQANSNKEIAAKLSSEIQFFQV